MLIPNVKGTGTGGWGSGIVRSRARDPYEFFLFLCPLTFLGEDTYVCATLEGSRPTRSANSLSSAYNLHILCEEQNLYHLSHPIYECLVTTSGSPADGRKLSLS